MKIDITNQVKDEFLISLKTLISYPSVLNEGENGTPFGQAIQDVLEKTLEICRDIGFTTYLDPKGYYGYAEIGQGAELLAILCHLDVVPSGDEADWQTPPFEATIKDGWVFGRGVQDDKGPSLAALYAVKSLLDQGIQFKKRVRFIFGTDEETLWRCMARYNTIEEQASMGFAPDSSFPLTYAEKGLLQVKLHGPGSDQLELEVGGAFNVVPDKANYQGPLYEQVCNDLKEAGYDYQSTEQTV
ncbi:TPA: Sapep family Mn(2+)-dependent dipeptidase, partial [Streptococcus pneumoniae]|nr:Sapep family Mn(2+)-dependent dipeptidase [Streptococcus pneumoniae]